MPEIIVLDTHIWLWFVNQDLDKFPLHWQERIEVAYRVGISPVSCFEIALACKKGRLILPCETSEWINAALEPSGIEIFPLTPTIASCAVNLSEIHKDPFDRIIIATAIEYNSSLASIDGVFSKYPELNGCLMKME
mgnify:CR=1 FL=1